MNLHLTDLLRTATEMSDPLEEVCISNCPHPPLLGTLQQVAPVHAAEPLALLQRVGEVPPERLRQEERRDAAQAGEGAHDHQRQDPVDGSLQRGEMVRNFNEI